MKRRTATEHMTVGVTFQVSRTHPILSDVLKQYSKSHPYTLDDELGKPHQSQFACEKDPSFCIPQDLARWVRCSLMPIYFQWNEMRWNLYSTKRLRLSVEKDRLTPYLMDNIIGSTFCVRTCPLQVPLDRLIELPCW